MRESRSALSIFAFFAFSAIIAMSLHSPIFLLVAMALLSVRQPRLLGGFALIFVLWGLAYAIWFKPGTETIRVHGDMTLFFAQTGRWISSPSLFVTNTLHWMGESLNLVRFWWLVLPIVVLIWLARERNVVLLLLAAFPPIEAAVASVLHIYPYGEVRLMIFCFPALFLLIAASLADAARRIPALMLLLAPFLLAGIAGNPYNDTYMHVDDLRPMYEMIVRSHAPGEAIYADPSFAVPLRYEYPAVSGDVHSGVAKTVTKPGWYIQYVPAFSTGGASVAMRIGGVVAVRSTAGSP
jgi:hypothetical protein